MNKTIFLTKVAASVSVLVPGLVTGRADAVESGCPGNAGSGSAGVHFARVDCYLDCFGGRNCYDDS